MTFMGESSKCPRVETIGIGSFLLPQISWWWPHNQWQHLQPWPPHPMSFMLKITKNNKNQGSAAKRTTYVFHFLLSLPWFSRSGLNIKRNFLTDGWETLERIVQWRNYTAENLLKTTSYWKKKKSQRISQLYSSQVFLMENLGNRQIQRKNIYTSSLHSKNLH